MRHHLRLPIDQYLEMTRRFAEGYIRFGDQPIIKNSIKDLYAYMKDLKDNGLRDYQVGFESSRISDFNHRSMISQVATVVNHANEEEKEKTDQEYEEEYDIRFEWDQHKNLISPQTFYWYVSSFPSHIALVFITFLSQEPVDEFFLFHHFLTDRPSWHTA